MPTTASRITTSSSSSSSSSPLTFREFFRGFFGNENENIDNKQQHNNSSSSSLSKMAPTEETPLCPPSTAPNSSAASAGSVSTNASNGSYTQNEKQVLKVRRGMTTTPTIAASVLSMADYVKILVSVVVFLAMVYVAYVYTAPQPIPIGAYALTQYQVGKDFIQHYAFFQGKDPTLGYNYYVNKTAAVALDLYNVSVPYNANSTGQSDNDTDRRIFLNTAPKHIYSNGTSGKRLGVRLEGKTLFNDGLFIIDLQHMPVGCGVWPAFWLTNEKHWPHWGEVDLIEGINNQPTLKTALHTSRGCSVADASNFLPKNSTIHWETANIPPAWGGSGMVNASDCWRWAPHQWNNQGCVEMNPNNKTISLGLNAVGGGIFALEWDPIHGYIRSWAFAPHQTAPANLRDALRTAKSRQPVRPDPTQWPTPYAYFPIGPNTTCSSSHFKNMRIVFDTAFCGAVAAPLYPFDCPAEAKKFPTCDDYVRNNPDKMQEAYWEFSGVYVYQRHKEYVRSRRNRKSHGNYYTVHHAR